MANTLLWMFRVVAFPFQAVYFALMGLYMLAALILTVSGFLFAAAIVFVLVAALVEPVFVADAAAGVPLWKTWAKILGYSMLVAPVFLILRVLGGGGVFVLNK